MCNKTIFNLLFKANHWILRVIPSFFINHVLYFLNKKIYIFICVCILYNKCKNVSQKKILMINFYFENYFSLFFQAFFLAIPYIMLPLYTLNISKNTYTLED